jgi:GNAT superfamily N-acetyltransferase
MNKSNIIALYDQDQRIDVVYPSLRREITSEVVRHVNTSGDGEGVIIYSRLDEANADEIIRQQVSYFQNLGQDFEWKVYDYDRPHDLKDRLEAHGFTIEEAEAILVLDLEKAPAILWQPVSQDVRRIVDPDKLSDVLSVHAQVWDEDSGGLAQYLGSALRDQPGQMSVYVAYVDAIPASAAWIYFPEHSPFASLWGGSTLSDYRQRGLYTALLAVRAQEARDRQVRYLTVDASPMSRPILEKFGFEMFAYSYPCKWKFRP